MWKRETGPTLCLQPAHCSRLTQAGPDKLRKAAACAKGSQPPPQTKSAAPIGANLTDECDGGIKIGQLRSGAQGTGQLPRSGNCFARSRRAPGRRSWRLDVNYAERARWHGNLDGRTMHWHAVASQSVRSAVRLEAQYDTRLWAGGAHVAWVDDENAQR